MPGDTPEPETPPDDGAAPRKSFSANLQAYLQARAELISIESKEAASIIAKQGVFAACLGGAAFFAYALVLVAAVSLLGRALAAAWPGAFGNVGWQVAALLLGLLHVIAAACFVRLLRRKSGPPLFEYTRSEFQKDREWLQDNQSGNENGS